jgi:Mg2+ and Co2+ transporter CorA
MAESSTTNVNSLIINKVSRRTYKDMYDSGTLNNSQLYVIKDATLDAVGSRVLNVATPELFTDAANMGYVNTVANEIKQNLIGNVIYRGHITLGIAGGLPPIEVIDGVNHLKAGYTLADIVCAYLKNTKGLSDDDAANYELDNGSAFQFTFANNVEDDTYTTSDANPITITNNDYIIVNNHEAGGSVKASQLKRDNIDLIDIQYNTLVQKADFDTAIADVNNSISAVSGRVATNTQSIGANSIAINNCNDKLNQLTETVNTNNTTLNGQITSLSEAIDSERSDRAIADASIRSDLTDALDTAVNSLNNSISANNQSIGENSTAITECNDKLNQLTETVNTNNTTLSGQIGSLNGALEAEETNRVNGDASVRSELTTALNDAVNSLNTNITTATTEVRTELSAQIGKCMPKYTFETVSIVDGSATLSSYTSTTVNVGENTTFEVKVADGDINVLRDCIMVVQCGKLPPEIKWNSNFHPRSNSETDFNCVANSRNVFYITEYTPNHFVVSAWCETEGGNIEV